MKAIVWTELQRWLSGRKKVAILCIGSEIRRDDSFGPVLAERLKQTVSKDVTVIDAGTTPENYTGIIRRLAPTHVLMVDTAEMGLTPGESRLVKAHEIEGFAISTHAPPLRVIAKYLSGTTRAKVALLAVQPRSLEFGEGLTDDLKNAINAIAEALIELLAKRHDPDRPLKMDAPNSSVR